MTYAFIQDVPANEEIYAKILTELGDVTPPGMIAHLVIRRDNGLRYVDVWEREEDWTSFRDQLVEPAVSRVLAGYGIPHEHSMVSTEEIEIIHAWVGAAQSSVNGRN